MHGDEFRAVALAALATKLRLKLALTALRAAVVLARQRRRLLMLLDACNERDLQRDVVGQLLPVPPHRSQSQHRTDVLRCGGQIMRCTLSRCHIAFS